MSNEFEDKIKTFIDAQEQDRLTLLNELIGKMRNDLSAGGLISPQSNEDKLARLISIQANIINAIELENYSRNCTNGYE